MADKQPDNPARQAVLAEGVPEDCADQALALKRQVEAEPSHALDWSRILSAFKKWGPLVFDIIADLLGDGGQAAPKAGTRPRQP